MDGDCDTRPLAQAGYVITGSGGGGAGGQYVFVSLEQVDEIITEVESLLQDTRKDGAKLLRAARLIEAPAQDIMSVMEARTTTESLAEAERHNRAMAVYLEGELTKLRACRANYARSEEEGVTRLRNAGRG